MPLKRGGCCHNGGRLAFYGGPEPSDYIETRKGIREQEGKLMSDYELLSLVLAMFQIVVSMWIASNINTKK